MSRPTPLPDSSERFALAPLSTLGLGGAARWYFRATRTEQIGAALEWCGAHGIEPLLIGGGSNLVIADAGWPGLVLQPALRGVAFEAAGAAVRVTAAAGEPWDALVAASVARDLAGLECLSGIPGWVGGTPIQNVGAYGQEVAETIESVTVLDRASGVRSVFSNAECGFGYRSSRFKGLDSGRYLVLEVAFRLRPGGAAKVVYPDLVAALGGDPQPSLAAVRDAVLAVRRHKGMVLDALDPDTRSVGSFFMNPVLSNAQHAALEQVLGLAVPSFPAAEGAMKIPAAWLIERAGFTKGTARGAVGLSTKHPLALINRGGATAQELIAFAREIQLAVHERFNMVLRVEPEFVGFGADPEVAALRGAGLRAAG